jgi:pimeloyl-ACP methyl ester carboxylesterase
MLLWILAAAPPAKGARLPEPVAVVSGKAAPADAVTVALCPDVGFAPEVWTARDGDGLARRLASERFRVFTVDPWSSDAAHQHGVDGVLREVFPHLLRRLDALGGGKPVLWVGHGLCGLLPILASATPGAGLPLQGMVGIGTRLDFRAPSRAEKDWLLAWSRLERPLSEPFRDTMLTGLRPGNGPRPSSAPPGLDPHGHPRDVLEAYARSSLERPAPSAVVEQVIRWYKSRRMDSAEGWLDYRVGYQQSRIPALFLVGGSDPVAPAESVLATAESMPAQPLVRVLSRVNGHREEYGHLGLLLSRFSGKDVDECVLSWLRGGGRCR